MKTLFHLIFTAINLVGIYYLEYIKIQTKDEFTLGVVTLCTITVSILSIGIGVKEINSEKISKAFLGFVWALDIIPALYLFTTSFAHREFFLIYVYIVFVVTTIIISTKTEPKPSPP